MPSPVSTKPLADGGLFVVTAGDQETRCPPAHWKHAHNRASFACRATRARMFAKLPSQSEECVFEQAFRNIEHVLRKHAGRRRAERTSTWLSGDIEWRASGARERGPR